MVSVKKKVVETDVFVSNDGREFKTEAEALQHERKLTPFNQFWNGGTWGGKALRDAGHTLDEFGIWRIEGEGPADFGSGGGSAPHIATVRGTLRAAINFAVIQPKFWGWGGGGTLTKYEILDLTPE